MTLCDTLSDLFGWSSLNEKYESLSVDGFEEVVQENRTVLLDVRTAEEYAESHIARAIHIDMNDPKFKEKAQAANITIEEAMEKDIDWLLQEQNH